jgi:hypothetical protein
LAAWCEPHAAVARLKARRAITLERKLLSYRYFLCDKNSPPRLVGLFTEPIGEAYVSFLEDLGIAAVWKQDGRWIGSGSARAAGIAD